MLLITFPNGLILARWTILSEIMVGRDKHEATILQDGQPPLSVHESSYIRSKKPRRAMKKAMAFFWPYRVCSRSFSYGTL